MSSYGIFSSQPGPQRRSLSPRLLEMHVPQAALYMPQLASWDLPVLESQHWNSFIRNTGPPVNPSYYGHTKQGHSSQERQLEDGIETQMDSEGEESFDKRDNRDRLTRLQWSILERCADRTEYKSTPPHKWTAKGIEQACLTFATDTELAQLKAEQNGETRPIPFRVKQAEGEFDYPACSEIDQTLETELYDPDPGKRLAAQQQREISPGRAELESRAQRAVDVQNNDKLRPHRQTSCYPCKFGKRTCVRTNPDGPCNLCLKRQGEQGAKKYKAADCCKRFMHEIPDHAKGPGTWFWERNPDGWLTKAQQARDEVARGERSHVGNRAAKTRVKQANANAR